MAYDLDMDQVMVRVQPLLNDFVLAEKIRVGSRPSFQRDEAKGHDYLRLCSGSSLYIVDEPFLGLDPVAIADLIQLLADEKAKGKSILMMYPCSGFG